MKYLDYEIGEYLGSRGIPFQAYSLVGEEGCESPCIWLPEVGFRWIIIEKDGLANAVVEFLARWGARRFPNSDDVFAAAHEERWQRWEQHAP